MRRRIALIGLVLVLAALAGCRVSQAPPPKTDTVMIRLEPSQWPDLGDDLDPASLDQALDQSRVYLRRLPGTRSFKYGPDTYTARRLLASLDAFGRLYRSLGPGQALNHALAKNFILYKSVGRDGAGEVLCTGYYEPLLSGSLTRSDRFCWPAYQRPHDLIEVDLGGFSPDLAGKTIKGRLKGRRLVPYYTRREIDRQNALAGKDLELVWVDDPVALFFLHIQGSGRIRLPGGRVMRVGYAGANGRPYRSLGRRMIELELLNSEKMSMQAIRAWLAAHPDQAPDLLDHNESYVFFHRLEGGPVGNINVPLTPGRSVALDHRILPKGALAWLQSRKPVVRSGQVVRWQEFSRFVLVQDTGGAIRGPGRLDLFFGHGQEAETGAGRMKEPGRLFFLVMKNASVIP